MKTLHFLIFFSFTLFLSSTELRSEVPKPPWEIAAPSTSKNAKQRDPLKLSPSLAIDWIDGDSEGPRYFGRVEGSLHRAAWTFKGAVEAYRWRESTFLRKKRHIFVDDLSAEKKTKRSTLRIGRFRTIIGSGVLWNPFDVLDPINPNRISLVRRGSDKFAYERINQNGGILSMYAFPEDAGRPEGFGVRFRKTSQKASVHPFVFKFDTDLWSYGLELSTNIGKNASWAQIGRLADERGGGFQGLVGVDLAIPKAPLLRVEYFRNELEPLISGTFTSTPPSFGFDLQQSFLRSSAKNSIGLNIEGTKGSLTLKIDHYRSLDDGSSLSHLSLVKTLSSQIDGRLSLWLPSDDGVDDYDGTKIYCFGVLWKP